jgi:hypothetical protein
MGRRTGPSRVFVLLMKEEKKYFVVFGIQLSCPSAFVLCALFLIISGGARLKEAPSILISASEESPQPQQHPKARLKCDYFSCCH